MNQRARGIAFVVAGGFGIVVTILDSITDSFSVWNAIGILLFAFVLVYGVLYIRESATRR